MTRDRRNSPSRGRTAHFNYYVSAVAYNSDDTHIARLRVHQHVPGQTKLKPPVEMTRPEVVALIKAGKTVGTMFKKGDEWRKGAALQIIPVTTEYLKTTKDASTRDNLEELPKI